MDLDFDKYKAQQFCDNSSCSHYGKVGFGNIKTHSFKCHQVYCNGCGCIWVITKGTFFYALKTPIAIVLKTLHLLSEGIGLRSASRVMGVTVDSILDWVLKAANHVNEITVYLESELHLTQCQIDEFWSFIKKRRKTLLNQRKMNRNLEIVGHM